MERSNLEDFGSEIRPNVHINTVNVSIIRGKARVIGTKKLNVIVIDAIDR